MADPYLVVSEVFGPTASGEGPTLGRRCGFVRLGGCNLSCTFCDTGYTWDASRYDLRAELTHTPVPDILTRVDGMGVDFVIITGGEPLLQQKYDGFRALVDGLTARGIRFDFETNGTVAPDPWLNNRPGLFVVSPKLAHALDPEHARLRPDVIAALAATGKAVFKFVCATEADVNEAAYLAAAWHLPPHLVWIMPEGTDPRVLDAHLRAIADPAIGYGFNLTTRLHVHAWGDERAR